MDIQFEGWARKHGRLSIASFDLTKTTAGPVGTDFSKEEPLIVLSGDGGVVERITVNCHTHVRLGGEYQAMVTLSKKEIARLYYLTHQTEVDGLVKTLPIAR